MAFSLRSLSFLQPSCRDWLYCSRPLFLVMEASGLQPQNPINLLQKYANDTDLVVPASHSHTVLALGPCSLLWKPQTYNPRIPFICSWNIPMTPNWLSLRAILILCRSSWMAFHYGPLINNLTLKVSKSREMIIRGPRIPADYPSTPDQSPVLHVWEIFEVLAFPSRIAWIFPSTSVLHVLELQGPSMHFNVLRAHVLLWVITQHLSGVVVPRPGVIVPRLYHLVHHQLYHLVWLYRGQLEVVYAGCSQ